MGKLPVTHDLTTLMVDCVTTKKSKYVISYAVLTYCSKYYKYLKGFVSLSYSNVTYNIQDGSSTNLRVQMVSDSQT